MFETVDQVQTSDAVTRSTAAWGVFCCGLLIGWVNPLVSAFVALFALDRAPRFPVFCSGAIVRFLLLSVALASNGELCVGFYAWLAGISR